MSRESLEQQLPAGIQAFITFDEEAVAAVRVRIAHEQASKAAYATLAELGRTMIAGSERAIDGLAELVASIDESTNSFVGDLATTNPEKLPIQSIETDQPLAFDITELEVTDYSPAQPNLVLLMAYGPEDEDCYIATMDLDQLSNPVTLYEQYVGDADMLDVLLPTLPGTMPRE